MHYHRGILTVLVSAALLAATVVTAVVWYYPWLPDPAQANRRELIRWLVTRNLAEVPETTREVLAQRLEEEFSGEIDWATTAGELTDEQRHRLLENVGRLVGPWVRSKARSYAALPEAERAEYLDRLIDVLEQWRGLEDLAPPAGPGEGAQSGLLTAALKQLETPTRLAGAAEHEPMRDFLTALRTRWAVREFARHVESAARQFFSEP